jgi:hypothetical protein
VSETLIAEMEKLTKWSSNSSKDVVMQVRPHLLYIPNQLAGKSLHSCLHRATYSYYYSIVVFVTSPPRGRR